MSGTSTGSIWKFGDDVDTDQIIASQYIILPSIEEMAPHTFESIDPGFAEKVRPGDVVLGGSNFGCGSSREQAPRVLKALGVQVVVAKSYARIFYRNAINIGLPALICADIYDAAHQGDAAEVDLEAGTITLRDGTAYACTKLPRHMQQILSAGGLIESLNAQEGGG